MNIWDLFKLDGKVALVTGGARNLGYDMALALAEAGADMAITSRTLENAQLSAEKIAQVTGRTALPLACDVRFEDQVERELKVGGVKALVPAGADVVNGEQGVAGDQVHGLHPLGGGPPVRDGLAVSGEQGPSLPGRL